MENGLVRKEVGREGEREVKEEEEGRLRKKKGSLQFSYLLYLMFYGRESRFFFTVFITNSLLRAE